MAFLDAGNGLKLYWTVYQWYNVAGNVFPSHGASNPLGSTPNPQGRWYLGDHHPQMTAGYVFDAAEPFADRHLGGKRLISGLQVSQGTASSSNGPAMFAYAPWQHPTQPPPHGARLDTIPLVYHPEDYPALDYKRCDAWRGGAWPVVGNKQAALIAGTKGLGQEYYGIGRPQDCSEDKGYHCTPYEPQVVLYDPADLAAVARGERAPWSVVPYRTWSPQAYFWPACLREINGVAFDHEKKILYLLQSGAYRDQYESYPLVHVFAMTDNGPPPPVRPGDLNGDGRATLADLIVLIKMLLGQVPPDLAKGDLDGNGTLGLGDVRAMIQRLVAG